jgi:hypothetical protein
MALGLVVSAVLVIGAQAALSATPVTADPISQCSATTGVIVAVDFAHWGGNIEVGCDATLTSGYDALHAAGFTTAGDDHDGPAFVCRIDNYPPPSEDPCVTTPPALAYWSYWHADAGQSTWAYSRLGPMSYVPPAGGIDAWVFGASKVAGTTGTPPFSPSQVRAMAASSAAPPTTGTSPTTSGARPTTAAPSVRAGTPSPTKPAVSSTATTGAPPTTSALAPSTSHPGPPSTLPASRAGPKIVIAAPPPAGGKPSSGSPALFIVGAVVLLGVGAGGALLARRRQRADRA